MANKKTYKVKVPNETVFERVQTLVRATGQPEEQLVGEALEMLWGQKEDQVREYMGKLLGNTALFDGEAPKEREADDQD
jgi:hypothetical protein